MRGQNRRIQKVIDTILNFGLTLSGISVLLMTLIIFIEIVSRSFFNYSTLIADEMAGYLNVAIVFLGLGYTFKSEGFIKITLLYSRLPAKIKHITDTISVFLALVYSIVLFYFTIIMVHRMFTYGTRSLFISKTPLYIPQSVIVIGLFILILQIIFTLITRLKRKDESK